MNTTMKGCLIVLKKDDAIRILRAGYRNYIIADIDSGIIITNTGLMKKTIILEVQKAAFLRGRELSDSTEILYIH